jgi:hypothetical protein
MVVINEQTIASYRALLDEEETAFDDLEHAFEEGDRECFEFLNQIGAF